MKKLLLVPIIANITFADIGTLSKLVDGDTVHFNKNGKTINCRLAYIDTPESKRNKRAKSSSKRCKLNIENMVHSGKLSSTYTGHYLQIGKKYHFEIIDQDQRYGRAVCEIYTNNKLFNLQIVKDGYAVPYYGYIKDSSIKNQFHNAALTAEKNKLGLWGADLQTMQCLNGDETTTDNINNIDIEKYINKAHTYYNKIKNLF